MIKKKQKLKINLGAPIKLKPSQAHKSKKFYDRKKTKIELKSLTKSLAKSLTKTPA